MTPTPFDLRRTALAELRHDVLDVLVIGGGIVGVGVARDAALRGLRVGLVEQYDFASGTSGRSSRLLHGGLRYLAQGRIGLVRQASREKKILAAIAPHLVRSLAFTFPTFKGSGWPRWKLRLGVKLYDWLNPGGNLGPSAGLSPDDVRASLPGVRTDGLTGGVRYFDALTNDARLVIDTLRSAAAAGAIVANYVALASAARGGTVWRCRFRDTETGEEFDARARAVVNAAGAWAARFPASRVKLRLTKGIHVVVDRARLPVTDAVVTTDGPRVLFAIPWGERVILGTTDTDYAGPLESPDCTPADVACVLGVVGRTFPAARLSDADVISAWSGLRPLIGGKSGKPSDISRAHRIIPTEPGWWDVAGGKLTTYRLMAEETVDRIAQHLGRPSADSQTGTRPLLANPDGDGVLPPVVSADIVAGFVHHQWARHVDDVMVRRAGWRYDRREHLAVAEQVAAIMARELGWSAEYTSAELARYHRMTAPLAIGWEAPPPSAQEDSAP